LFFYFFSYLAMSLAWGRRETGSAAVCGPDSEYSFLGFVRNLPSSFRARSGTKRGVSGSKFNGNAIIYVSMSSLAVILPEGLRSHRWTDT
jgi:hypothetical protein